MTTTPKVAFGLYGLAIKQDGTPTCSDTLQTFSKLADLTTGGVSRAPIATFEPDYWLLDGNYRLLPAADTNVHIGLMSLAQSDGVGVFASPPVLTVTFASVHSSNGLTLHFSEISNDYASSIRVRYYDASNVLIQDDTYSPTSAIFTVAQTVSNFKKITITFSSTNKPTRYLRLTAIDYGKQITFTGADIKNCSVIEDISPMALDVPACSLDLTIHSTNPDFNILAPAGDFADVQNGQPMDVYETVNGSDVFIGRFYLQDWENPSLTEFVFHAIDEIGILDAAQCYGGLWFAGSAPWTIFNLGDFLTALIAQSPFPFVYELDPELYATPITRWIWLPICSWRQVLQQIAILAKAYVTCSRSTIVRIRKNELVSEIANYDYLLTNADIGLGHKVALRPQVTGVEITAHDFSLIFGLDNVGLFKSVLPVGRHTIIFDRAPVFPSITGPIGDGSDITVIISQFNYMVFDLLVPGTVTITGYPYAHSRRVYGVYNASLDPGVKQNVLSITDAYMVNSDNVAAIAQRIYNYYQERYVQKAKLFAPAAAVGDSALADTLGGYQIAGIVERMEYDLAAGFVAQTEIVGSVA